MRQYVLRGYRVRIEPEWVEVSTYDDTRDGLDHYPHDLTMDKIINSQAEAEQAIKDYFYEVGGLEK